MPLSAAQMAAMSRLLDEALPLDAAGRQRWLAQLPAEYADLKPALREALLPNDEPAKNQLDTLPKIGSAPEATSSALCPGERVGPYELVRPLGTGGMAEVWLAHRADGALRREVALKLPTLWRVRADLAQRFARERDILAGLEHANIARLYDAGVSAEGMPYLALEYVQGMPLTAWCDEHRLGLRERLKLFLQVLDAVQYAHGHHVIHRDLKPSNILVTEGGQVRLLDFGVAKLLLGEGDADPETTQLTQTYGRALTLEYASPEHLRGDPVNATSDIYSLGVLLYELLTGSRPYRVKPGATPAQLEQAITTANIDRPSDRVGPDAGEARATTSGKIVRHLRGDLDAIVLKALTKDPRERYGSASALADDLQRYLSGEPVEARPDRPAYQMSKFVLRHRAGTAAAVAMIVAGVAGVGLYQTALNRLANGQRASTAAASVSERSIAVLPFIDMSEKKDQEYFSDGLSEELIERLSHSPDLRVVARTSSFYYKGKQATIDEIANALHVNNLLEGSVRKSGDEVRVTAQLIRTSDGTHLWSQTYDRRLSDIFKVQDDIAATVAGALHAALNSNGAGAAHHQTNSQAYSLLLEADFFRNRGSTRADTLKAIDIYEHAIKIDPNYALAWVGLGKAYRLLGTNFGSETPISEYIAKAHDAMDHALRIDPNLAEAHSGRGQLLSDFDWNWAEAAAEFRRAHELGRSDVDTRLDLADTASNFGRLDEAVEATRVALSLSPLSESLNLVLGFYLFNAGRYNEAASAFRRVSELNPPYAGAKALLAAVLLLQGNKAEALEALEQESDDAWKLQISPIVYWDLDRKPESDAALIRLETQYAESSAYNIAQIHAYRGELDAACAWLQRAYRQHDSGMASIRVDPLLRKLHGDTRYLSLVAKLKLDGVPPAALR